MTNTRTALTLGWLLVAYHAGNIAWYPDKATCEKAQPYFTQGGSNCVPDRFEFEEGGSLRHG